jgi:UDP-N-acetylmuramate: L-alanyl-gamma-D-glutamyl-meso-diaminopimelate ligase
MEIKGTVNGITIYDDFAHHPTAIATTLDGLRNRVGEQRIIAIIEPRSHTMRMGIHKDELAKAWIKADLVHVMQPAGLSWSLDEVVSNSQTPVIIHNKVDNIVKAVAQEAKPNDHVLVMSNGGFDGIHNKLISALGEMNE